MKEIIKHLLVVTATLISSISTSAFTVDGISYEVLSMEDFTCAVTRSSDDLYIGNISIPEVVQFNNLEFSVAKIGNDAFLNCAYLMDVTIPNSVTGIGSSAFSGCGSLTSITIPNSVTEIGSSAFSGCGSLTSITIPNSVTEIGSGAFSGCTDLTSVTISESLTSIGNEIFKECIGLTNITIPNSVTSIGDNAFRGCIGLTSITIPESSTSIGKEAFRDCTGLTSVTIPGSVTSIGDYAFDGCTGLTQPIYSNTHFSYYPSSLSSVSFEIPEGIKHICAGAFRGCTGLTSVTIPNSVTEIGSSAFSGCTGLTSITIPNSVTTIGDWAFYVCTGLTSVAIPNSATEIDEGTFSGCTGLTSVTIPGSVTFIGDNAFRDCTGLTSLYIEDSDLELTLGTFNYSHLPHFHAFAGCNIETLYLGRNLGYKSWEQLCLSSSSFKYLEIGDSYTSSIEYKQFQDFTSLISVKIGSGVRSIGDYSFKGCTSLKSFVLGNVSEIVSGIVSFGTGTFDHCWNLESMVLALLHKPGISPIGQIASNSVLNNCTLYVPEDAIDKYKSSSPWWDFGAIKPLSEFPGFSGVDEIREDSKGHYLNRSKDVYTLQGMCLKRNASQEDINDLPTGIYVIGGKKIIVR